jgi:hypothetical protein
MSDEPPFLSYRKNREGFDPVGPSGVRREPPPSNRVVRVLTRAILLVVLGFWLVIGAAFWVPLMIRSMVVFSVSLIESMFEGKRPEAAAGILRDAVSFYRRGFVVATEVILRDDPPNEESEGPTEHRIFREVLWGAFIWYVILLAVGLVETSPIDAWNWWADLPWGEWVQGLLRPFQ